MDLTRSRVGVATTPTGVRQCFKKVSDVPRKTLRFENPTHTCDRCDAVSLTTDNNALRDVTKIHVRCRVCDTVVPCKRVA